MNPNENTEKEGAFIPPVLFNDPKLNFTEMILLVKIDFWDNSERGCFASNETLGGKIRKSAGTTANMISKLRKRGYIEFLWFDGRNRGLRVPSLKNESCFHKKMKSSQKDESSLHEEIIQPSQKNEHKDTIKDKEENTQESERESENEKEDRTNDFKHIRQVSLEMYEVLRNKQPEIYGHDAISQQELRYMKRIKGMIVEKLKNIKLKTQGRAYCNVSDQEIIDYFIKFINHLPAYMLQDARLVPSYICSNFDKLIKEVRATAKNNKEQTKIKRNIL